MDNDKIGKVAAQCKKCRRVVYTVHLDRDGYCCFCGTGDSAENEATGPSGLPQSSVDPVLDGSAPVRRAFVTVRKGRAV